jgi:hypothetical protein
MEPQDWGVTTQREGLIYLHLLSENTPEVIVLPGSRSWDVKRATLLRSGEEVGLMKSDETEDLAVSLPDGGRSPFDTVVVLAR